jgi:hypothetical protein
MLKKTQERLLTIINEPAPELIENRFDECLKFETREGLNNIYMMHFYPNSCKQSLSEIYFNAGEK